MEEEPIEKIPLENGLTLELYDRSRRLAGDRWLVHLFGSITIDVEAHYPKDDSLPPLETVKKALGDTIRYSFDKKSHFVDESEKDSEFETLRSDFLNTGLAYVSRPGFAGKLILRRYNEQLSGQPWRAT